MNSSEKIIKEENYEFCMSSLDLEGKNRLNGWPKEDG